MPGGSQPTSQPDIYLPDLDLEKCGLEQRIRRHETQHQQHDGQQHEGGLEKRHGSQQQNAPKQDGSHASSDDPGSANTKVEKTSKQEQPKQSVFEAPPVEDIDPAADRIATDDTSPLTPDHFYELMGLQQPRSAEELNTKLRKLALHNGLYKTIWNELQWIQYKYKIFAIATYVLMTLQLLISAIFIILGSLRRVEAHTAIAVLGAISTVIGGILALMKGNGLPHRLREARNQMQYVVFEAEELFWDFRAGKHILYEDIKKLREDYLRVMEQLRMNHPDSYSKAAGNIMSGSSVTRTKIWRK